MATEHNTSAPCDLVRVRKRGCSVVATRDPDEHFELPPVAEATALSKDNERMVHITQHVVPSREFMANTIDRVRRRKRLHAVLWPDAK